MARKTKEQAMETRASILDAAIDVFHRQGIAKSSLEEIAETAGVTRGAIYWHFKNKADIFSALHDRLHTPIMTELLQRLEKAGANPLHDLADFCIDYLKELERNKEKQKIYSLFFLSCDYSGELSHLLEEYNLKKQESLKLTTNFFKTAIKQGILPRDSDANLLALSFFCYICGICQEFLTDPKLFNLEKQAQPLILQFFKSFNTTT